MSRRIITVLSCGALALGGAFVAGCGSDNDDSGSAATTTAAAPATAAEGSVVEVSMKNNEMVPERVTAKVGQKVVWTNDDGYPHNVTATDGADFASDNFSTGTYEYTPTKAGTIDYVCTIHTGQNGTIEVTE